MSCILLNRGQSVRPPVEGARILSGDIRDPQSVRAALGDLTFDAVVDWIAYTPAQIEVDLDLFRGRTGQYVFISSASAYQKPAGCTAGDRINRPVQSHLAVFTEQDRL